MGVRGVTLGLDFKGAWWKGSEYKTGLDKQEFIDLKELFSWAQDSKPGNDDPRVQGKFSARMTLRSLITALTNTQQSWNAWVALPDARDKNKETRPRWGWLQYLRSHSLSESSRSSLLPPPHPKPGSGHPQMHMFHKARRRFSHSLQECMERPKASLRNLVVAPLQAREDDRRDHHIAGLINVHGDDRAPKVERPGGST